MKRLTKCCCCASTRTGTLIVAVLGIVLSIITIIVIWVAPRHQVSFTTFIFDDDVDRWLSDNEGKKNTTNIILKHYLYRVKKGHDGMIANFKDKHTLFYGTNKQDQ